MHLQINPSTVPSRVRTGARHRPVLPPHLQCMSHLLRLVPRLHWPRETLTNPVLDLIVSHCQLGEGIHAQTVNTDANFAPLTLRHRTDVGPDTAAGPGLGMQPLMFFEEAGAAVGGREAWEI